MYGLGGGPGGGSPQFLKIYVNRASFKNYLQILLGQKWNWNSTELKDFIPRELCLTKKNCIFKYLYVQGQYHQQTHKYLHVSVLGQISYHPLPPGKIQPYAYEQERPKIPRELIERLTELTPLYLDLKFSTRDWYFALLCSAFTSKLVSKPTVSSRM